MKFLTFIFAVFVTVAVTSASFAANTNADYAGLPPYVSASTNPNVLLLLDNSGSMAARAACEIYVPFVQISCPSTSWDPTVARLGMFDNLTCYTFDAGNSRFVADILKGTLDGLCPVTEWDGNLLNWIVTRRVDAVKQALIGGQCAVARIAADGTCPPIGVPPLITMTGQPVVGFTPGQQDSAFITAAAAVGRVPDAVRINGTTPDPLFFVVGIPSIPSFCVNDHVDFFSCTPGAFTTSSFPIQVGVAVEPTGSIQNLADKVRWALMVFNDTTPGGTVLTPMGQRQALSKQTGLWTTWPSNSQAMIEGIQSEFPRTGTPLAESLYDAARYFAQLPSAENVGYVYPIAFTPAGAPFQDPAFGPGSMAGPAEISSLTAPETCPAGYLANACGRDPFFFGSNHTPPWSLPSAVVACCRNFILIMTDGFPQGDVNVPAAMQDLAHSAPGDTSGHQGHCSGPDSFTACAPSPPPFQAAGHKTDYPAAGHYIDDVAFWVHTTDLRPDNGNPDPTKACNTAFGAIPAIALIGETGHCLPGDQKPIIYTFFASFNISVGREPLMEAAKQGGFLDQNDNNRPDLVSEWDSLDNVTGLAIPDGIPDTYFEASNGDDLKDKLDQALTSILKRAASGTSISTLSSSSTGIGAVYQSYFFPAIFTIGTPAGTGVTPEVDWTGYVQGLFVDQFGNLREDFSAAGCTGPPDGKLIFKHDCIVKLRFDPSTNDVKVDRFQDLNEDGIADTVAPFQTVSLSTMQPMWEAGHRLALTAPGASCAANTGGVTCRRIITWADINNDGVVGSTLEFSAANKATLCPYLGGTNVSTCVSGGGGGAGQTEAKNIINFIRGVQDPSVGYRNRLLNVVNDLGATVTAVWPLGDIMNSSPVLVGAPSERFDALYGDVNYSTFFRRYKDRRKVVYVGANDGMLHAFNAGYLTAGDDLSTPGVTEQERFLTQPVQPGTSTLCVSLPCDGSAATYAYRTDAPKLGAELWAFIPQDLLPQLKWLTSNTYSHVYYVDLKPKITDVRIFCNDDVAIVSCIANSNHADHPGGWGTILIGGFRFGGSCKNCTQGHGGPRTVTANFGSGSETRVFMSSYFVLDITNPEKDPSLLWVFRDQDMGLGTSQPAIVRIKPPNTALDPKTASTNEKWFVTFGSGPTNYDANSSQPAQMFAVDLMLGPRYLPSDMNKTGGTVRSTPCTVASPCIGTQQTGPNRVRLFPTGLTGAFMGDESTLDFDLDFRVDVIYAGSVKCTGATPSPCNGTGPVWQGAMWRLLTNGDTDPDNWGVSSGPDQKPTKLISTFTCAVETSPCANKVGPVTATPVISTDDTNNIWVFFGTGRYYSSLDKVNQDPQQFFGVKDCVLTTPSVCVQTHEYHNLKDVSNVVICTSCAPTASVSLDGGATFTVGFKTGGGNLVNNIQNMDGWVTNLPNVRERSLAPPTLLGGTLFFTSFITSDDLCDIGGQGLLYALYYGTGTPFSDSMIGTSVVGANTIANASLSLGIGMPSQAAVQIGAQGTGAHGTTSSSGCIGQVTAFVQAGTGAINQFCAKPALSPWSRMLSWRDL